MIFNLADYGYANLPYASPPRPAAVGRPQGLMRCSPHGAARPPVHCVRHNDSISSGQHRDNLFCAGSCTHLVGRQCELRLDIDNLTVFLLRLLPKSLSGESYIDKTKSIIVAFISSCHAFEAVGAFARVERRTVRLASSSFSPISKAIARWLSRLVTCCSTTMDRRCFDTSQ